MSASGIDSATLQTALELLLLQKGNVRDIAFNSRASVFGFSSLFYTFLYVVNALAWIFCIGYFVLIKMGYLNYFLDQLADHIMKNYVVERVEKIKLEQVAKQKECDVSFDSREWEDRMFERIESEIGGSSAAEKAISFLLAQAFSQFRGNEDLQRLVHAQLKEALNFKLNRPRVLGAIEIRELNFGTRFPLIKGFQVLRESQWKGGSSLQIDFDYEDHIYLCLDVNLSSLIAFGKNGGDEAGGEEGSEVPKEKVSGILALEVNVKRVRGILNLQLLKGSSNGIQSVLGISLDPNYELDFGLETRSSGCKGFTAKALDTLLPTAQLINIVRAQVKNVLNSIVVAPNSYYLDLGIPTSTGASLSRIGDFEPATCLAEYAPVVMLNGPSFHKSLSCHLYVGDGSSRLACVFGNDKNYVGLVPASNAIGVSEIFQLVQLPWSSFKYPHGAHANSAFRDLLPSDAYSLSESEYPCLVAIRCYQPQLSSYRLLCCANEGFRDQVTVNRSSILEWETFALFRSVGDDKQRVAFRSCHGTWLGLSSSNTLVGMRVQGPEDIPYFNLLPAL